MPRTTPLLVVFASALVLAACQAGAATGPPAPAPAAAPAGWHTVVERRLGDAALVVTITDGAGGTAATMEAVDDTGDRTLVAEEVVVGDDHYVHLAAAVGPLFERAAWINLDRTDERHAAFLETNRLGLVEQAALFDARVGDAIGTDRVVAVERISPTRRVLELRDGLPVEIRRRRLDPSPVVGPRDSLPIVAFADLELLATQPRSGGPSRELGGARDLQKGVSEGGASAGDEGAAGGDDAER